MGNTFKDRLNYAPTIDKLEVGIFAKKRPIPTSTIAQVGQPKRIRGKNNRQGDRSNRPASLYMLFTQYRLQSTGNPFLEKSARRYPLGYLPPYRLQMVSRTVPLTLAQVEEALDGLYVGARRSYQLSSLEFTFDLENVSYDSVKRCIFTRARHIRELEDEMGRRTLYIGSPRSSRQIRIYEKAEGILRVEFVFRRSFLRENGFRFVHDLAKLRQFDLSRLVRFREFDRKGLRSALDRVEQRRGKIGQGWLDYATLQDIDRWLRKRCRIDTKPLLRSSPIRQLIEDMQQRFDWTREGPGYRRRTRK